MTTGISFDQGFQAQQLGIHLVTVIENIGAEGDVSQTFAWNDKVLGELNDGSVIPKIEDFKAFLAYYTEKNVQGDSSLVLLVEFLSQHTIAEGSQAEKSPEDVVAPVAAPLGVDEARSMMDDVNQRAIAQYIKAFIAARDELKVTATLAAAGMNNRLKNDSVSRGVDTYSLRELQKLAQVLGLSFDQLKSCGESVLLPEVTQETLSSPAVNGEGSVESETNQVVWANNDTWVEIGGQRFDLTSDNRPLRVEVWDRLDSMRRDWSWSKLAQESGDVVGTFGNLKSGGTGITQARAERWVKALKVTIPQLFGFALDDEPNETILSVETVEPETVEPETVEPETVEPETVPVVTSEVMFDIVMNWQRLYFALAQSGYVESTGLAILLEQSVSYANISFDWEALVREVLPQLSSDFGTSKTPQELLLHPRLGVLSSKLTFKEGLELSVLLDRPISVV